VVTGKSYETALQELILAPLGLEMTFFYPNDILFTHRFVVGHQKIEQKVEVARHWAIGRAGNGVGGVVSTVPTCSIRLLHTEMGQTRRA
jgi:CubicO group peptidase (beta-lactamase class C family)